MGSDDSHGVADGGRLELRDNVLNGGGKGRCEHRDDEQDAHEGRNGTGCVANDQTQPDGKESQHGQVEATPNDSAQHTGLGDRRMWSPAVNQ